MQSSDESLPRLPAAWQSILRDAVRTIDELARVLELPLESLLGGGAAARDFPLLVPRGFLARMRHRDTRDPLLLQVLPTGRETQPVTGFVPDPLSESRYADAGVVRKYASRALVVTTGACPVHCRYCFRRSFPYDEHNAARNNWNLTLQGLKALSDVREVILSGGDPLSLTDRKLGNLIGKIADLDRVDTLRIHTRFPVMIPERVTPQLTRLLKSAPFATVVIVHVNHPNEIDADVAAALAELKHCTGAVLNQSVLLRGVNDDAGVLAALSRRLFECGVLPYYLHMLDRVAGAAHFLVSDREAVAIVELLREELPGYLVPKLVREVPGRLSKTPVI